MYVFKRWEILLLVFIVPTVIILFNGFTGFIPEISGNVTAFSTQIAAFAFFVGGIITLRYHSMRIAKRREGWQYSIFLIIGFTITILLSILNKTSFDFIITEILRPMVTAMTVMGSFYAMTTYFRGSRKISFEAMLLLISSIFILLRNVPIGEQIWSYIPVLGNWIDKYPSGAVMAAFWVLVGVGSIALIIRIILGYEKRVLGVLEE